MGEREKKWVYIPEEYAEEVELTDEERVVLNVNSIAAHLDVVLPPDKVSNKGISQRAITVAKDDFVAETAINAVKKNISSPCRTEKFTDSAGDEFDVHFFTDRAIKALRYISAEYYFEITDHSDPHVSK